MDETDSEIILVEIGGRLSQNINNMKNKKIEKKIKVKNLKIDRFCLNKTFSDDHLYMAKSGPEIISAEIRGRLSQNINNMKNVKFADRANNLFSINWNKINKLLFENIVIIPKKFGPLTNTNQICDLITLISNSDDYDGLIFQEDEIYKKEK